jgi:hypothetical protein
VICPLCGLRKARRTCPALGRSICAICCGTKRLTEIRCPSDCTYLISAREHPAAAVVRQQQRDLGLLVHLMRDLSERQSRAFLLIASALVGYKPSELEILRDDDVAEAAAALAATYETADRGVIYEHRPASLAAGRLVASLKPLLAEASEKGGVTDRDFGVVLRRVEEGTREARAAEPGEKRAFIHLLGRIVRPKESASESTRPDAPRLIVP